MTVLPCEKLSLP